MACSLAPREIVIANMTGAVPERPHEMLALWERYDPEVIVVPSV